MSLHLNIGIVTMQCALKIKILLLIVIYTLCSVSAMEANARNDLPVYSGLFGLQNEKIDSDLESTCIPPKETGAQIAKDPLPLNKVAHKNVMDLLDLFFIPKPMHLSTYTPLLQEFGLRINWFECLQNLWSNQQNSYAGGVDFHCYGPIQLSVDFGYLAHCPKDILYNNTFKYKSKGRYGLAALSYVTQLNRLSKAYLGIAYGQSRFNLTTFYKNHAALTSNHLTAGWIKFVGGSELKLMHQLYGGVQIGIAHLLHCKKNDDDSGLLNYSIPGYGKIANKIMPDIVLYLKWNISFLEKKIVI